MVRAGIFAVECRRSALCVCFSNHCFPLSSVTTHLLRLSPGSNSDTDTPSALASAIAVVHVGSLTPCSIFAMLCRYMPALLASCCLYKGSSLSCLHCATKFRTGYDG